MSRKPIPRPGFLDECDYLGYIYGQRRWRSPRGFICTWDSLHGEIEVFNARGEHRGVIDAVTGKPINPARKGRMIRV